MQNVLSQNIKYLRKEKDLSQEKLAHILGIKRSNITAYETKNVEPRLRIILELAKFFNISIKALLTANVAKMKEIPPYTSSENNAEAEHFALKNIDRKAINQFVDKSIRIRKILDGFKAFYSFKKNNVKNIPKEKDKLILEIDNFIQLMEYMLSHNESFIKALQPSSR